jgi:hypothetical protein
MARKPYKPKHLLKTRMIPILVTEDFSRWLREASNRLGVTVSEIMREGARRYVRQLERKDGSGKEKKK